MYGVPENLDLSFLHGAEVVQVRLGLHQVQLCFHPNASLSVEGRWELLSSDGLELDQYEPPPRERPFQLHRLLGQKVVGGSVSAPAWFSLRFENGDTLRVFDSSQEYESFSIDPGARFI